MTPVKQITPMTCFLACIESFLKDYSISLSQAKMIRKLSKLGLCSDEGTINREEESKACKVLGISFRDVSYHYPIDQSYNDGSLLIGTSKGGLHCVRFYRQKEGKIIVMDPSTGTFRYWDKPDLEKTDPRFHRIELEK